MCLPYSIPKLCCFEFWHIKETLTLCEKCPNTEFFLVWRQENTDQKKLRIWTLFTVLIITEALLVMFSEITQSGVFCVQNWKLNSIKWSVFQTGAAYTLCEVIESFSYVVQHRFSIKGNIQRFQTNLIT